MVLKNLFEKNHDQKFYFGLLGFLTVFLLVFTFNFLATKIQGLKDNYISLFCSNLFNTQQKTVNSNNQVDTSS